MIMIKNWSSKEVDRSTNIDHGQIDRCRLTIREMEKEERGLMKKFDLIDQIGLFVDHITSLMIVSNLGLVIIDPTNSVDHDDLISMMVMMVLN